MSRLGKLKRQAMNEANLRVLGEQSEDVNASADDDLIKIVKDGIAYLYRLEVNKMGKWLSIDVNLVDLAKKIFGYLHPIWRTKEQAKLDMQYIDALLNQVGKPNIPNLKMDDGTELKLTLKKTYKV